MLADEIRQRYHYRGQCPCKAEVDQQWQVAREIRVWHVARPLRKLCASVGKHLSLLSATVHVNQAGRTVHAGFTKLPSRAANRCRGKRQLTTETQRAPRKAGKTRLRQAEQLLTKA